MKYQYEILMPPPVNSEISCIPYGFGGTNSVDEARLWFRYPPEEMRRKIQIFVVRDGVTDEPLFFSYIDKKNRVIPVTECDPNSRSMEFGCLPTSYKENNHPEWKARWLFEYEVPPEKAAAAMRACLHAAFEELQLSDDLLSENKKEASERYYKILDTPGQAFTREKYILGAVYYYYQGHGSEQHVIQGVGEIYKAFAVKFPNKKYCDIIRAHVPLIELLLSRTIMEKLAHAYDTESR